MQGWVLGSQPQDGADSPGPGALRAMPEAGRLFESCTLQTKEDRPHLNRVRRKGDLCPFKGKSGAEHLDLQNSGLKRPRLCLQLEASSLDPEAFVSPCEAVRSLYFPPFLLERDPAAALEEIPDPDPRAQLPCPQLLRSAFLKAATAAGGAERAEWVKCASSGGGQPLARVLPPCPKESFEFRREPGEVTAGRGRGRSLHLS